MSLKTRVQQHPDGGKYVTHMPFKEYKKLFEDFFVLTRENGILEIRWHSNNEAVKMDFGHSKAWAQLLRIAGEDPENEVMILTGTGDKFVDGINPEVIQAMMITSANQVSQIKGSYDDVYLNGLEATKSLIFDVHVPTIGIYNGPSIGMSQMVTLCDITLCADDVIIDETHFTSNKMPGNGPFLAFQRLLGEKRANHMLYTGEGIPAEKAQELGLISEVLPREKLLPRAWEIAESMMRQDRPIRRLSHDLASKGLRRAFVEEVEYQMALSTYGYALTSDTALEALKVAGKR